MKNLFAILLMLVSVSAFARAGSYSRSYSRPSRSYSAPRTVIRNNTTVVHSGPGLLDMMVMSSLMNRNNQPTTVVVNGTDPSQVQVVQVQESHGIFYYLFWAVIILVACGLILAGVGILD